MLHSFWFRSLLALIGGLCVPLALAPFNFWPLMFIGIALFIGLTHYADNLKQAMWFGWLFGAGYFGVGVSWIYGSMQTVDTPLWLSLFLTGGFCLLMALFHLFQAWSYFKFLRYLPKAVWLVAPLWWVINEWIREWFLTGMPWLYAGYATLPTPIAQNGAIVGIYGLSFVVAFVSALLLSGAGYLAQKQHKAAITPLLTGFSILIATSVVGALKPADSWTVEIRTLKTAAVQSNVDQRTKWSSAQQRPTLEFYGNSISHMTDIDLVLWPEAAMTRRPDQIPYFISQLDNIGKQRDQAIITGMLTLHDGRFYNAMMGYGTADGEYQKQHLVPFGEYVPLESVLRGLIAFFDLPMSTMYPAPVAQLPMAFSLGSANYFAAPVICYEAAYPEIVRKLAVDANIITVVSNDAWFGDSIGPHQHLEITQMRAIENGRPILRATQNGISALIDANGRVLDRSEQFVEAKVIGELTLRSGKTPFQRVPSGMPVWLMIITLLSMVVINRRKPA